MTKFFIVEKDAFSMVQIYYEQASDAINDLIDEMLYKGQVPPELTQAHAAFCAALDKVNDGHRLWQEAKTR